MSFCLTRDENNSSSSPSLASRTVRCVDVEQISRCSAEQSFALRGHLSRRRTTDCSGETSRTMATRTDSRRSNQSVRIDADVLR